MTKNSATSQSTHIKINRVRAKNFRCLKSIETTLGDITLLIGANNSGKTSFFRALTVALNSDRKFISKDDLFIDRDGKYPTDPRIIVDIEIVPVDNGTFSIDWAQIFGGEDIQFDSANNEFFAYRTIVDFSAKQTEAQIKRYVIKDWDSGNVDENQEVTANISKIPLFFIDAQRDLQEDLKYAQSYFGRLASQIEYDDDQKKELEQSLNDLNIESVNKSPVLTHLKTSLEELNKTVQTKGSGVEITPFPKKLRDLHKGLKVNFQDGGSETFSLEYHGMGTRSWASLLGYKAFVNWMKIKSDKENDLLHPILALEEPEAHLHPNAQRQVYSQLKGITGQKIISTHSPYITPLVGLNDLRVFYKEEDSSHVADLHNLVSSFSPREIYNLEVQIVRDRGELLFARLVILFEGATEAGALPVFAKSHWGIEAFEKGICFVSSNSDSYKIYVDLLEALKIPWVILSDYDNIEVQRKINNIGTSLGVANITSDNRFILLNASIEKYLLDQGFRKHIEEALFAVTEPVYVNEHHKRAKEPERSKEKEEIINMTDEEILNRIDDWKAKIAPIWAKSILNTNQVPQKVKDLFNSIDQLI